MAWCGGRVGGVRADKILALGRLEALFPLKKKHFTLVALQLEEGI